MFRTLPLLLISLGLTTGCGDREGTLEGACNDHGQCDEMQACIANICTDVDCLSSLDCALHNYCKTDEDRYECIAGCESDDDCTAGEECSEDYGTCEDYGCRSTELDCPVGHTCNLSTGDCTAVQGLCTQTCDIYGSGSQCGNQNSCQVSDWGDVCDRAQDCDDGFACDMFLAEHTECERDQDCTVAGATCYGAIPGVWAGQCVISYCHADHCMPKCDLTNPDCPAGFSCYDFGDAEVCYGACEWYVDNGFL